MDLDFMTPDVWDGLVLGVIIVGLALAVLRLYVDLSRRPDGERTPPPPEPPPAVAGPAAVKARFAVARVDLLHDGVKRP